MNKNIYVVRHGLSTFNKAGRMQGSSDESVLTDVGRRAALDAGAALKDIRFDRVVASPLARARQTCDLIMSQNSAKSVGPEFDLELREANMYDWEGQSMVELRDNCPEQWHNWQYDPAAMVLEHNGKNVYPLRDLYSRAQQFVSDNLDSGNEENILLVSHGGTNQALINSALGLGVTHHQTFQQSNCCISRLSFDIEAGQYQLIQLNNTAPLGEKLPKLKARKEGLRAVFLAVEESLEQSAGEQLAESLGIQNAVVERIEEKKQDLPSMFAPLAEDETSLHGVLVVGKPRQLAREIKACFGFTDQLSLDLDLVPGTVTAVHHSRSHPRPIIQCVNTPISS